MRSQRDHRATGCFSRKRRRAGDVRADRTIDFRRARLDPRFSNADWIVGPLTDPYTQTWRKDMAVRIGAALTMIGLMCACSASASSVSSVRSPSPMASVASARCAVSASKPAHDYSPDFGSGPAFGPGPVYALWAGGLGQNAGWLEGKVLWMVRPDVSGHLSVSGRQLDGGSPVAWDTGSPSLGGAPTLEFDASHGMGASGWSDQPSNFMVRNTGCFSFEVTGPSIHESISILVS